MKRIVLAIAMACLAAAPASAQQTTSDLMTHYRAYQAALQNNDLDAAEAAAVGALAAAEASNDRRTAALALNLAGLRLSRNNAEGALAPSQRALQLAQQGAPNVSPVLAQLFLGRAELGVDNDDGARRLLDALPAAEAEELSSAEIYDAAVAVGTWTFRERRYGDAELAWSVATNHAHSSRMPLAYAEGRARTWRAASMALSEINSTRRGRLSEGPGLEAYRLLIEASSMLSPLALAEAPDGAVTVGQQAYAESLAWRAVMRSKLTADGITIPATQVAQGDAADGLGEVDRKPMQLTRPRCYIRLRVDNSDRLYPDAALNRSQLGGVAVRIRTNETGEVIEARAISTVGDASFTTAVNSMDWEVERRDDSPPNCRMDMTVITSVAFMLG